jgi:outer membrane protein assembly factor BamB
MNGKLLNKLMYGNEWTTNYVGTRATPIINNGKIYLMSGLGDVICLNESNLNVIWKKNMLVDYESKNITWGINESPLIIGEKIIITPGGKEHNVVALNKNTGERIWSSPGVGELSSYCSPLYIGDQQTPLIVTKTAYSIIGLEASTGKLLWTFESKNRHQIQANTPFYANNMILCSSVDKGATMLRLSEGGRKAEIVWEIQEFDNMMGGVVKVGNYIYGSDSGEKSKYWWCVNWETGEILFKERGLAVGVTIFADGMLYCYSDKGEMALVKPTPEKFTIVSQFPITKGTNQHWAHPVIHQGVLYVRHGDCLMAYRIK